MRRWAAAAVAGSALLTVAACGGGDSAAQPQTSTSSAAPAPQEPAKPQPLTSFGAVVAAMGQACAKLGADTDISFAEGTAGVQERVCTNEERAEGRAAAWVWEDSTNFEGRWRQTIASKLKTRAAGSYRSCAIVASAQPTNWGLLYADLDEVEVSPEIQGQVEAGFARELPEPGACAK